MSRNCTAFALASFLFVLSFLGPFPAVANDQAAITITAPSSLTVGNTATLSITGGSGSGAVTYTSSSTSICTVSASTVTAVAAGTCSITATKAADASFNAATATATFTVSAPAPSNQAAITITAPSSLTVGNTATLSITGGSGSGAVTYTSSSTSICTVSASTVTAVAAGTCSITATKAADASFNAATATATFTVSAPAPSNQAAITITAPSSLTVGNTATLSITGGSGSGAVTYTSSSTSICTVSASTVTAVAAGTCSITATKAADASFNAATATATFTVSAPVDSSNPVINGSSFTLSSSSVLDNGSISISITGTDNVGITSITATLFRNSNSIAISSSSPTTGVLTLARTSGDARSGTWSVTSGINFRSGAADGFLVPGLYDVLITAIDAANNQAAFTRSAALTVGQQTASAYVITSSATLSATTVPNNSTLDMSIRVVSYVHNVTKVTATFSSLGSSVDLTRTSGNTFDGTYSGKISIPLSAVAGTHILTVVGFTDNNRSSASVEIGRVNVETPAPSTTFTAPTEGQVVSGPFDVRATGAVATGSTAVITHVCLTWNGNPVIGAQVRSGTGITDNWAVTNSLDRNCTPTYNRFGSMGFAWRLDPTTWANGTHTLGLKIIDSTGKESAQITRVITNSIAIPTTTFTAPTEGQVVSGPFDVRATGAVANGSTAVITHVCLTWNGNPVIGAQVRSGTGITDNWAVTNSLDRNCTPTYNRFGSMGFAWRLDPTTWANGTHTLGLKIIDSTGKESAQITRVITNSIAIPTTTFTAPTEGQVVSGPFDVRATGAVANGSTAVITHVCLTWNGNPVIGAQVRSGTGITDNWAVTNSLDRNCTPTYNRFGSMGFAWRLDPTTWANGTHTLGLKIIDSTGKESAQITRVITNSIAIPTTTFTAPTEGQVVSGPFDVRATGAVANGSTAVITHVCLTWNGNPVIGAQVRSGTGITDNWAVTNSLDRNCTPTYNRFGSMGFAWRLDPTTWANGTHTLGLKIIDSTGKESAQITRVITNSIAIPTTTFTAPTEGQVVSGPFDVRATGAVANGSTAVITHVCLTWNGNPVIGAQVRSGTGITDNWAVTNSLDRNCTPTYNRFGSMGFAWRLDPTTWANGTHTLGLKIIDSTGKESAQITRVITNSIAIPTTTFTAPTEGQVVSGPFDVRATGAVANGSTAVITHVCLTWNGNPVIGAQVRSGTGITDNWAVTNSLDRNCTPTYNRFGSMGFAWRLDPTTWANGTHTLGLKIIDSTGKESAQITRVISVNNPPPTVSIVRNSIGSSVVASFSLQAVYTSSIGARYIGINAPNSSTSNAWSASDNNSRIPLGYTLYELSNAKSGSFEWQIDATTWKEGPTQISVIVVDLAYQVVTESIQVNVRSVKPSIEILTPQENQTIKGKFTFIVQARSVTDAKRFISQVGISEQNARSGDLRIANVTQMPSKFRVFQINDQSGQVQIPWQVDFSKAEKGRRQISFAVQDSAGDVVEKSITVNIEAAQPRITILSPSTDQTFQGDVKFSIEGAPDPSSSGTVAAIAIGVVGLSLNSQQLVPEFAGSQNISSIFSVPVGYLAWSIQDLRRFSFSAKAATIKDGGYTLNAIVFDDSGNSASASVKFSVSTASPTLTISSPRAAVVDRSTFTLGARATPNGESRALIIRVGVNKPGITPSFSGTATSWEPAGPFRDFYGWSVSNLQDFSWNVNPRSWPEGDNTISIVALDSNGKTSVQSVTVHIAPIASFNLKIEGTPVLNRPITIAVDMVVDRKVLRTDIPITLVAQISNTAAGPWRNLPGDVVIDATGRGLFQFTVEGDKWVRVSHDTLDAVQITQSESLRIFPLPSPDRAEDPKATSKRNPDGSIPTVTCAPPKKAEFNKKFSFICNAIDVQDESQPINIYQVVNGRAQSKEVANIKLSGGKIRITFAISKRGISTFSFQVRGESAGDKFVPWRSETYKIQITK